MPQTICMWSILEPLNAQIGFLQFAKKKKKVLVSTPLNLDCPVCTQRQHKENASIVTLVLNSQIPSTSAHATRASLGHLG